MTAIRTTTIRITQTPHVAPGVGAPSPNTGVFSLEEVFDAYFDCRRHKRNTINQLAFEADLETNLVSLWRELNDGSYKIGRSIAFVVKYPKIREIWAADFRDRVVHHVIYNAIKDRFYNRFIRDTYACIPGRGTHDGLRRVSHFARSITRNWTRPAYVLKADIANFFNSIDRRRLLEIVERHVPEDHLRLLIRQVTMHDPRPGVMLRSSPALFAAVPPHKSLMRAPDAIGLPIGNLTSQFFANVYLNELDQFVKHRLKCRYYGRYVDDVILFHEDAAVLNEWYDAMDWFLEENLGMKFHPRKKWLNNAHVGIDFVGFVIKPGRTYLRRSSLNRCRQKIRAWERKGSLYEGNQLSELADTITSYLGMLQHVNGYKARKALCWLVGSLFMDIRPDYTKISPAGSERKIT